MATPSLQLPDVETMQAEDVLRWAYDDVSLEGFLYGNEFATSDTVGVASWHRVSPTLLVDDFQDADAAHNSLGGANNVFTLRRSEETSYPPGWGDFASLGVKHSILTLDPQNSALQMVLAPGAAPQDVSGFRNVVVDRHDVGERREHENSAHDPVGWDDDPQLLPARTQPARKLEQDANTRAVEVLGVREVQRQSGRVRHVA